MNSHFSYFSRKLTILIFSIDSNCIIKNHHKFHNIEILRNVFAKESKNGHEKQKQNLNIKGYGTKPNNKNKKERMRPYCLHKGLELFKSTKVIDMFWNIRGINLACYWAFDAKKSRNYAPKEILGLPIISIVTTPTSCIKK